MFVEPFDCDSSVLLFEHFDAGRENSPRGSCHPAEALMPVTQALVPVHEFLVLLVKKLPVLFVRLGVIFDSRLVQVLSFGFQGLTLFGPGVIIVRPTLVGL